MQHNSVKRLFREQLNYYLRRDQSAAISPIIPLFLDWAKGKKIKKIEICEFGGSAGQLLTKIAEKYPDSKYTNVELIGGYKNKQVSKNIQFVCGSILSSKFKNDSFDAIIIRDILHHLIGKNFRETRQNQIKALCELKRIVKPGGAIFIEELTNNSKIASRLIYFLSNLNSKIGLKSTKLNISVNTIIAILTPRELSCQIEKIFGPKNIIKSFNISSVKKWQIRLVHLGVPSGKMILVVEKSR